MMDEQHKDFYNDRLIEEPDAESLEIEDILGDISSSQGNTAEAYKEAQIELTKVKIKALTEKLQARKEELWSEWNEAFFDEFSEAFAKFKNGLIELHLNDAQLKTLEEKLDAAVNSMQDRLDSMLNDFMNAEEEAENEA